MATGDRREFLGDVGQGMLAVLVGPALAGELGLGGEVCGASGQPARRDGGALGSAGGPSWPDSNR